MGFIDRIFGRKIKLDQGQYNVITGIANELGIPKEEVLWVFVELGQHLAISSQESKVLEENLDRRKNLPEYKNWKEIARLNYEMFKLAQKK